MILAEKKLDSSSSFKVNQANTLWWNCFSVLDVLLLLFYSQLKDDLSPKAVFYINNIIWFLGLDIYHLYLTVKLWMRDTPSLKDVQREIASTQESQVFWSPGDQCLKTQSTSLTAKEIRKQNGLKVEVHYLVGLLGRRQHKKRDQLRFAKEEWQA